MRIMGNEGGMGSPNRGGQTEIGTALSAGNDEAGHERRATAIPPWIRGRQRTLLICRMHRLPSPEASPAA
jgi:hypothetical protein